MLKFYHLKKKFKEKINWGWKIENHKVESSKNCKYIIFLKL